jgi:hypothetical protein
MSALLGASSASRTTSPTVRSPRRFQQREGVADVEQPDGFEIRAEEGTRGAQHVVAIGPGGIPGREFTQSAHGERAMGVVSTQEIQRRRMHRALGGEQLGAHGPPLVVCVIAVRRAAPITPMSQWQERVELEQRAMHRTAPAAAREARLRGGNGKRRLQPRRQFGGEAIGNGAKGSPGRRFAPALIDIERQQQHHGSWRRVHRVTDTSSPRRSITTFSRRTERPCTPRA